ncbi:MULTISPECIES: SMI1/KNR4 family protein [Edwardsiella]|uniref:MoeA domain-containing protein n=2 Tax=Edwardsiella anguillarum TaxID=1821960 RepID=A0A076LU60_9GAMM|nr:MULTISPECIES: SMI1/KNR4 family protein [Edwardsiella]AKM48629.1 hypothetical protein QY76_16160 [Edwardsiella sp. EA181011]GAJ67907.1 hypothetical protein MA13_contig00007-0215 [Edwardsiella piscicida]AIJ09094.1 MoeA domain-containing protein [Edwardsiella anguillarum ET080813]AKR77045.1 SMI1/KNR4 family protein [Edwardsiella sp. LADL05-105]KAB0587220.1 molybdenum cofactor biosynthesis protein MoeA [Edwardsiella anguillarum]
MNELWKDLERWLQAHRPALLDDLNSPASGAEIRDLEQVIGASLPADFTACLLVHNGQKGLGGWLFGSWEFLSTQNILMSWSVWRDLLEEGDFEGKVARPAEGIRPGWWLPGWIPFASNGGGDYLCLDLTPAVGGDYGQVINVFHDVADRVVEMRSFSAWFTRFVVDKRV